MRKPLIWLLLLLIITFLVILVVVILLVLLWKGEKVLGWRRFIAAHLYHLFPLSCLVIDKWSLIIVPWHCHLGSYLSESNQRRLQTLGAISYHSSFTSSSSINNTSSPTLLIWSSCCYSIDSLPWPDPIHNLLSFPVTIRQFAFQPFKQSLCFLKYLDGNVFSFFLNFKF